MKHEAQALGFLADAMLGGPSYAAERLERGEQARATASTSLPRQRRNCEAEWTALGLVFGEPVDDLFSEATLPPGWSVRPSDHSMWNDIVDEHGRRRGSYFYKGAFWDRDAFLNPPARRFTVRGAYRDTPDGPPDYDSCCCVVMDLDTEIHRTPRRSLPPKDWKAREAIEREVTAEATAWLAERYPDHENPAAYWDHPANGGA